MSVKIQRCFPITDGIRVEDVQYFVGERERGEVDDDEGGWWR
jgi:hypothetical protein